MAKSVPKSGSDRWKLLKANALICLSLGLLLALFPPTLTFVRSELSWQDMVSLDRTEGAVDDRLVLIGIDDDSLKVLDVLGEEAVTASPELDAMAWGFPFPRSVYAALVRKLMDAGARLVVFDMVFPQPHEDPAGDAEFKQVLEEFSDRVVIAYEFVDASTTEVNADSGKARMNLPTEHVLENRGPQDPRIGFATFLQDADGSVRWSIGASRIHPNPEAPRYHSLAYAALTQLGEQSKWRDPEVPYYIRYPFFASPWWQSEKEFDPPYSPLPLYTLFFDTTWEKNYRNGEVFKDKIVYVGGTSIVQFHDVVSAPSGTVQGVQVQMAALSSVLHGDSYRVLGRSWEIGCVLLASMLACGIATTVQRPVVGLLAILLAALGYLAVAGGIYFVFDTMVAVFRPFWAIVAAGVFCLAYQFAVSQVEKARLRRTLERQVSKELAAHILNQPEDYYNSLPGVRKPVTILFSDIRGFTTRSEKDDPVQLVKQLKEYLDAMCKVVFKYGGVVDKFIGDAVMAVWGNIKSEGPEQDARNAVSAAVEMLEKLEGLNAKWAAEGIEPYAIGIGLNHGEVIFGQMGSEEKQEMTVIGDPVNQAARLEGLTKKFGEGIVIGDRVADFLDDKFKLRAIGAIRTKGKTEAAKLYGVRGNTMSEEDADWMRRYHAGLEAFENGDVPAAAEIFRVCAAEKPDDLVCHMYLEVIDAGETTGGALTMKEK